MFQRSNAVEQVFRSFKYMSANGKLWQNAAERISKRVPVFEPQRQSAHHVISHQKNHVFGGAHTHLMQA